MGFVEIARGAIVAAVCAALALFAAFWSYYFLAGLPFAAVPWRQYLEFGCVAMAFAALIPAILSGVAAARGRWRRTLAFGAAPLAFFAMVDGGHLLAALWVVNAREPAAEESLSESGVDSGAAAKEFQPLRSDWPGPGERLPEQTPAELIYGEDPIDFRTLGYDGVKGLENSGFFPAREVRPDWDGATEAKSEAYYHWRAELKKYGSLKSLDAYDPGRNAGEPRLYGIDAGARVPMRRLEARQAILDATPISLRDAPDGAPIGWGRLYRGDDGVSLDLWIDPMGAVLVHDFTTADGDGLTPFPASEISADDKWARLTSPARPPIWIEISARGPGGRALFALDQEAMFRRADLSIRLPVEPRALALDAQPAFSRSDFPGLQTPRQSTDRVKRRDDYMAGADEDGFLLIRPFVYRGETDFPDETAPFDGREICPDGFIDVGELRSHPTSETIGWAVAFCVSGDDDPSYWPKEGIALHLILPNENLVVTDFAEKAAFESFSRNFRAFEVSADGRWVRLTPRAAAPVWLDIAGMKKTEFAVVTLERRLREGVVITPADRVTPLMSAPNELGAAVASHDLDADVHGVLFPTGRVSGEWAEVTRLVYGAGRENDPCGGHTDYEPGAPPEDVDNSKPVLQTKGWLRYRDGPRSLVSMAGNICGS